MTTTPPMPLYVVTLNWNSPADTIQCVESILSAQAPAKNIVIVDNGSTDDSVRRFRSRFPAVSLITNSQNLGFGRGMNRGIKHALDCGAASILLLNNDTVIDPQMIHVLAEAYEVLGNPGILGPAIYYYDKPTKIWRLGDKRHRYLPMPLSVRRDLIRHPDPFEVDYVTGCGMLVARDVFERIGLFDKRYFMYFEDADFCRRARDIRTTVWCVPQAKMWHKVSQTAQRDKPLNRYHRALNQVRFYHEHPHGVSMCAIEAYIAAKVGATAVQDILHQDWDLIRSLWSGTIAGYRELRGQA